MARHGTVEKVSSLRSYTVVTPHGKTHRTRVEIRLASAPPADAKTYMSRKWVVQSSCQYDVMSRFGDFPKWRAKSLLMRRIK